MVWGYTKSMGDTDQLIQCRTGGVRTHGALARWFPTPELLFPRSAGVDISDNSIKWLSLKESRRGYVVEAYTSEALEEGIVEGGIVHDPERLGAALHALAAKANDVPYVHAALPEELAYVFSMHVPDARDHGQISHLIEFAFEDRVPLKVKEAVYDYDIVAFHEGDGAEIAVTVFPQHVVAAYEAAFQYAGLKLQSLEIEARSIGRAIVPMDTNDVVLVADFGRARTGIAVLKRGIPIFTSTVSVGGSAMTRLVMEKLNVDEDEAVAFKNEHGIVPNGDARAREAMISTAASLADEIARHYRYWDTKRNEHGERATPICRIVLCGGNSNLKGLPEYIAARTQARTVQASVWENVCDFSDYIPPIQKHNSLGYATAIGLALRSM